MKHAQPEPEPVPFTPNKVQPFSVVKPNKAKAKQTTSTSAEKILLPPREPMPRDRPRFTDPVPTALFDRVMQVVLQQDPGLVYDEVVGLVCVLWLIYFAEFTVEQVRWRQGSHIIDLLTNGYTELVFGKSKKP